MAMLTMCSFPSCVRCARARQAQVNVLQARPVDRELVEHQATLQRPVRQLIERLGRLGRLYDDLVTAPKGGRRVCSWLPCPCAGRRM